MTSPKPLLRILGVCIVSAVVLAPLGGCGGKGGKGREVRLNQPPKPPPTVPPRVDVPVDQGLRDLAWQELSRQKASPNP
ncbi:MAG: hypothetical protein QOF78_3159, partial [Phycisphaerales bacterium]|nr:hypothetical protein [Phycisphaerales bacterium]